jgi:iron complex outermembrane receptor protein
MKLRRTLKSTSCLLILSYLTTSVAAMADDTVLEEIIVTATKRGEVAVQDIAGGITAIPGEILEKQNLRTFEDIASLEPSLQISRQAEGDLQPIIRGIQSPGAGTVGVYFDETVITGINFDDGGGRTPDIGAYDMERVEILKGPQGTLFGASSMTGTVRFISNKPDASGWDANVRADGYTLKDGDPGFKADGMINIPVVEGKLAIRGVAWSENRGGFIDEYSGLNAVTLRKDADEVDKTGGRIMARFTPSDKVTFDAYYLKQDTEVDGPVGFSPVLTGPNLPVPIIAGPPFIVGLTAPPLLGYAGKRILTVPSHEENTNDVELFGATLTVDGDIGSLLVTASDFKLDNYSGTDTTGIATNFGLIDVGRFFGTGELVVPAPFLLSQHQEREVKSGEIRFSSNLDGPLNFVGGYYYQEDDLNTETMVVLTDTETGIPLCYRHRECIADPTAPSAFTVVYGTATQMKIKSHAFFGHLDFEINPAWTLGAGVRYFQLDQSTVNATLQAFQGSIPFTFPPAFGGPVQTVPIITPPDYSDDSKFNWDASLGYHASENQLYYFRAATGFRQGGTNDANAALQLGVVIPGSYDSDTVLSLEVGAKTTMLENRLIFNAAYFKMYWDDMQVPGQDATGASNFISNAAKAEVDGVEVELFARPTENWYLTFGVTYLDARLTRDQALLDPDQWAGRELPPRGLKGDKIPKAPEWALSGSAEYTLPVNLFGDSELAFRGNFSYTDKSLRFFNGSFDNNAEIGDYFLGNVSVNLLRDNWSFGLYCNNVTDEDPTLDIYGNGADAQHVVTAYPRSFGAQVQWRFK